MSPSRSPSPSPSPSPSGTPVPPGSCSVTYTLTNQWPGGFQAEVRIVNRGATAVKGWQLGWTYGNGQTVNQLWDGSYTQTGSKVTVTNASYNATIPANGGSVSFGFLGGWNGSNTAPKQFTLNGAACGA
ncbi:cellulose binding domain-containing protein [Microbispora sp. H10670]|uniref:cellulose binding domain-containing protein n=1 Tax=Microbispora sp. H10670 TaxID=2729108 RepID=UPI0037CAAD70